MKTIVRSGLAIIVLLSAGIALTALLTAGDKAEALKQNKITGFVEEKLEAFNKHLPEDKVYLHVDRPFYKPGDDIWFTAYVREGSSFKPSSKSDIVRVELINPKGNVEKHLKLIAKDGVAPGDFTLGAQSPGGLYKLKAYTNWQKNEAKPALFEKTIQVQAVVMPRLKMTMDFEKKAYGPGDQVVASLTINNNQNLPVAEHDIRFISKIDGRSFKTGNLKTDHRGKCQVQFELPENLTSNDGLLNVLLAYDGKTESISRSVPILLNHMDLSLFPEGGDLVSGLESQVAFKALNEFGKPADIEGEVIDDAGNVVAALSSFHHGMGAFRLRPEEDRLYQVRITKPKGIETLYEVPEALPRGYVLQVVDIDRDQLELKVSSTEKETLSLVTQIRGKVYHKQTVDARKGINNLFVSTQNMPAGVAQITLFDSKGIERAERLAFVNKQKQLNIEIETDKQQYLPREKVKMTIKVRDERGMPMPANLSLAVVDDQLLTFADDKSSNILSTLLLESDLKQKVEEPNFYFNPEEPKADRALDFLLMTSGWRRFTWKEMLNGNLPAITQRGERAVIEGRVVDASTRQPVSHATVTLTPGNINVETDANGNFSLRDIELNRSVNLQFAAKDYFPQNRPVHDYTSNLQVYLYQAQQFNNMLDGGMELKETTVSGLRSRRGGRLKSASMARKSKAVPAPKIAMPVEDAVMDDSFLDVVDEAAAPEPEPVMAVEPSAEKEEQAVKDDLVKLEEAVVEMEEELVEMDMGPMVNKQMADKKPVVRHQTVVYYRAREFAAPDYTDTEMPEERSDFRSTIYWKGDIEVDRRGKEVIEFFNSDDITSFKVTVEGVSADGLAGRTEHKFFTQLPFTVMTKVPVEFATGDEVTIPLTLKNNTDRTIKGLLDMIAPESLKPLHKTGAEYTLAANEARTIYLDYKVSQQPGKGQFKIAFKSCGLRDAFTQDVTIVPNGFPVAASISGKEMSKTYTVDLQDVVEGSITATLTSYPTVVSDLLTGVEAILREPNGCFEQTSMSSYPNAMVMDYLKTTGNKDMELQQRAQGLLKRGYDRLITFETSQKGYEWFGKAPAHEGLTAYGLMQFQDMKNVYASVDQNMIDRTAKWLNSRKDGNGGYTRATRAYHNFGRISKEIMNGYIVYALSEAGYTDHRKELDKAYKIAMDKKDPYQVAMVTNALFNYKDTKKAADAMEQLYSLQQENGSWTGSTHSITYSTGQSLIIETTALGILAALKSGNPDQLALNKAVEFLMNSRSGFGAFGNTQGTVLALKALTEYAKFSNRTREDGAIVFFVDGKRVAEKFFKADEKDAIVLEGLGKYISAGKHKLKIKYEGVSNALPYSLAVNWTTRLPKSQEACAVRLNTEISAKSAKVGETLRLTATLTNKKEEGLPSTMAIIGIPAGMSAQPWQLKELQEKGKIDYYEVKGNMVFLYYRGMAPAESKVIHLDLKAEIPGTYDAPASSAYLYYTNEFKSWDNLKKVTIRS